MEDSEAPLKGIKILDLSNLMAGPMTCMYLADFGADVVKAEHPKKGDEMRGWGNSKNGIGLFFKVVNRNKRTITLNLSTAAGQQLARDFAAEVDVVVESFRPGTLERWSLGYEELSKINPALILVRISGYGQSGPNSDRPGFGTIAEAMSGAAYINGYDDRAPLLPAFGLGDSSTAIHGAYAVTLSLLARQKDGKGQCIDLALYDGLLTMLGPHIIDFDQLGIVQERTGGRLPFVAPRNAYSTLDGGWIALSGSTQATFERTLMALGLQKFMDDPRFNSNALRVKNVEALDTILQNRFNELEISAALSLLREAGAPAGQVNSVRDVISDDHVQARENLSRLLDEDLGEVLMQSVVPRLLRTPGSLRHAGHSKGRDNAEVYSDWLGLDEAQLARLHGEGAL